MPLKCAARWAASPRRAGSLTTHRTSPPWWSAKRHQAREPGSGVRMTVHSPRSTASKPPCPGCSRKGNDSSGPSRSGTTARSSGRGLRPRKFEHRNGADSGGLARILGKAWKAPRLLGVDAVAFTAGQFADGHLVGRGSAFDTAVTGGGQVVVPVGVAGCSSLGREDVDDVLVGVVRKEHRRVDVLVPAFAAPVMHQDHRSALEVPANPALIRSELRDGLRVPVERFAHVALLSFTVPAYALGHRIFQSASAG